MYVSGQLLLDELTTNDMYDTFGNVGCIPETTKLTGRIVNNARSVLEKIGLGLAKPVLMSTLTLHGIYLLETARDSATCKKGLKPPPKKLNKQSIKAALKSICNSVGLDVKSRKINTKENRGDRELTLTSMLLYDEVYVHDILETYSLAALEFKDINVLDDMGVDDTVTDEVVFDETDDGEQSSKKRVREVASVPVDFKAMLAEYNAQYVNHKYEYVETKDIFSCL
jgi:hypothetical protein